MKPVKPMLWAAVLSLVLSVSTYAGDIQSPGAPAPNKPPATCTCEEPSTDSVDVMSTNDASTGVVTETGDFIFYRLFELLFFF